MGLILKLPFGNDIRKIEIDSEKNISFLDHDIEYDIAYMAMGGRESDEAKLFRLYEEMGPEAFMSTTPSEWSPSPDAFDKDTCRDWTLKFAQALNKQGVKKFGTRINDTTKAHAEMIVQSGLFEQDEFTGFSIYLNALADDEDEVVSWLVDWLKTAIENSSRYEGDYEALASLINEYMDEDDVKVTVDEHLYCRDDASYENTQCWQYDLYVREESVYSWTVTRQSRIWNPVTFAGGEDTDYGDGDYEEVAKQEHGESLANALSAPIPETSEPALPDHPESDESGNFAVLYEFGHDYSCYNKANEHEVIPYKTMYEADSAIELSGELFAECGDQNHVKMTILRRLTSDEKYERDMKERQGDFFDESEEEQEWHDEWTRLEDR
jgi:hypothetical protein